MCWNDFIKKKEKASRGIIFYLTNSNHLSDQSKCILVLLNTTNLPYTRSICDLSSQSIAAKFFQRKEMPSNGPYPSDTASSDLHRWSKSEAEQCKSSWGVAMHVWQRVLPSEAMQASRGIFSFSFTFRSNNSSAGARCQSRRCLALPAVLEEHLAIAGASCH